MQPNFLLIRGTSCYFPNRYAGKLSGVCIHGPHPAFSLTAVLVVFQTVYASLGDEALVHALGETEVKTVVADLKLMGKLVKVADKLTTVKRVIYFDDVNPDSKCPAKRSA